jgi:hypothetical protein
LEVEEGRAEDGKVEWIETRIHSKDRKYPTIYRGYASDYAAVCGPVAKVMPIHMLRVFSLRHAARLFTPIGGNVVTEEEAAAMMRGDMIETDAKPRASSLDELAARIAQTDEPEHDETSQVPPEEPADEQPFEHSLQDFLADVDAAETELELGQLYEAAEKVLNPTELIQVAEANRTRAEALA